MPNPWKLKAEMCEIGRRLYERGMVVATDGNLSARLDSERVLCTPTGMCKGTLKPEDLCTVDMSGKQLYGSRKRTSEVLLHLAVYKARDDVQAVVHAHPPHATAFAITRLPIPPCVLPEVEVFLGQVPTAEYATPGTQEFANTVLPHIRDANIIVLANHGTISYGKSLEQAFFRTEILDAYCRILLLSRSLGPVQGFTDEQERQLLELKQRLGLPDPRINCANCDLCGNNVLGRGVGQQPGPARPTPLPTPATRPGHNGSALPATAAARGPAATDVELLVQQITDRIMAELEG